MTKPDDVPQDVWELAQKVFAETSYPGVIYRNEGLAEMDRAEVFDTGLIARALLAEREACAILADAESIYRLNLADEEGKDRVRKQALSAQAFVADRLATAIRNRSAA